MRGPVLLGALTVLLTTIPGAAACEPTTSNPEVDACSVAGTGVGTDDAIGFCFYLDNDVCQPGCAYSIWFYPESNGREGLQRGDEMHDDTCGGEIESDTWVG